MRRALACLLLGTAAVIGCSSFASESPSASSTGPDASDARDARATEASTADGGLESGVEDASAARVRLVQSRAEHRATENQLTPVVLAFDAPPTAGNTVIVVVGNAGPSAAGVSIGGVPLVEKGQSSTHIASTVWIGEIANSLAQVSVTWPGSVGAVKNPTVFLTEWSGLGALAFAEDSAGAGADATTPSLLANGLYSLVLAVGATQEAPGAPTDPHFTPIASSGTGGDYVYLSLAFTSDVLSSYGTSWSNTHTDGWDAFLLAFR